MVNSTNAILRILLAIIIVQVIYAENHATDSDEIKSRSHDDRSHDDRSLDDRSKMEHIPIKNLTMNGTIQPSIDPTNNPTIFPSFHPTVFPTTQPTILEPTDYPTPEPTNRPIIIDNVIKNQRKVDVNLVSELTMNHNNTTNPTQFSIKLSINIEIILLVFMFCFVCLLQVIFTINFWKKQSIK